MSLLRITETPRRSSTIAGLLLVCTAGCGRKARHVDDAGIPRDAREPTAECESLFDRFLASLAEPLSQMGLHETPQAAHARDKAGLDACAKLTEKARSCLLTAKVGPFAWSSCSVDPPFTLFDATAVHERLMGDRVTPWDSAAKIAGLAGSWFEPARGLDDAITWTISPTGSLAVKRTNKSGSKSEPVRQLWFARDHELAMTLGDGTQFVPFHHAGDALYVSWTSGALAISIEDETSYVLDLADRGRWVVAKGGHCQILDPARGATAASCTWDGDAKAGTRAVVIDGDALAQRWVLREGALVHPAMETFTRTHGK